MFIDVRVILDMQFLSAHLLIWEIANLNMMFTVKVILNLSGKTETPRPALKYSRLRSFLASLPHRWRLRVQSSSEFSLFMALPSEFTLILHEPYKKSDQELLYWGVKSAWKGVQECAQAAKQWAEMNETRVGTH